MNISKKKRFVKRFFKRLGVEVKETPAKNLSEILEEEEKSRKKLKKIGKNIRICKNLLDVIEGLNPKFKEKMAPKTNCLYELNEKYRTLKRKVPFKKIISIRKSWDNYLVKFPEKFNEEEINFLLPQPKLYEIKERPLNTSEWSSFFEVQT